MSISHRAVTVRTRVVIVNDQSWVCEAMHALLERATVIQVVESGTCALALEPARSHGVDVLLAILDGDEGHDGAILDAIRNSPTPTVVMLHPRTAPRHVEHARRVASSAIGHTQPARDIVDLLLLAGSCAPVDTLDGGTSHLSNLDRRLIRLTTGGVPLSRIAELLEISRTEAWDRLIAILDLLQLSDRVQLAAYAIRHGLVDVGLAVR